MLRLIFKKTTSIYAIIITRVNVVITSSDELYLASALDSIINSYYVYNDGV